MLTPGTNRVGTTLRLTAKFVNSANTPTDPTTLEAKIRDPNARITTYSYPTSTNITKTSTGNYTLTTTPDDSGRWHVQWKATFADNSTLVIQDNWIVREDPFDTRFQSPDDAVLSLETGDYLLVG